MNVRHTCTQPCFEYSVHNLYIEKGRHIGIARNNRLYVNVVVKECIEEEYHFILVYTSYLDLNNVTPNQRKTITEHNGKSTI